MNRSTRRQFLKCSGAAVAAGATLGAWPLQRLGAKETLSAPRPIPFAICNETFQDWPFEKAFALTAECGYDGIEIAPFTVAHDVRDVSAARRSEIRRQADEAGLKICGLHWLLAKTEGFHLTSPDADVRRKTAEYLGELAQFCAELGGKVMIFGSPQQRSLAPGMTMDEGMQYAADTLTQTLPVLEKTDTILALEPLGSNETNFLFRSDDAVALAEKVDSPHCKMMLDCKAMVREPEQTPIPELIRRQAKMMAHFHANDPNLQGPGMGDLDFVPIFRALRDIDYQHWVSVEVFDYTPGAEALARQSIDYMKKCLAQVDQAPRVA